MPDPDQEQTKPDPPAFDYQAFPKDTLFHDRREGLERRDTNPARSAEPPPRLDLVPKTTERRANTTQHQISASADQTNKRANGRTAGQTHTRHVASRAAAARTVLVFASDGDSTV